jgi:hypothetical protein
VRTAGVRFSGVLVECEREDVARVVASAGATPTSWGVAADRTFASLALTPSADAGAVAALLPTAVVSDPARAVLRIVPEKASDVARLEVALAGPGGFAGVAFAATESTALVIEVNVHVTPLSDILAVIDLETGAHRRRIETIVPLDDTTLAALAGAILREPDVNDASRLIETHLVPILARGHA